MYTLASDEHEVAVFRKHWFVFALEIIGNVFLLFVPLLLLLLPKLLAGVLPVTVTLPQITGSLTFFFSCLWLLIIWTRLFVAWTDYNLDMWIITNKRILSIAQHGFFKRDISTCRLDRVQDVTMEIHGFLPTIMDYGDVHVQTAGEKHEFIINSIGDPKEKKRIITDYHDLLIETYHGADDNISSAGGGLV